MPLKLLEHVQKGYGFRLAAWYFAIFVVSSVAISAVSYVYLSSSLRDNRSLIQGKLEELTALEGRQDIPAVLLAAGPPRDASRSETFFIRILEPDGRTGFLNEPRLWKKFDLASVLNRPAVGAWQYVPEKGGGEVLEVSSARLPNGSYLQVGRTLEGRAEILEDYANAVTGVSIPVILIALAGGAFLALRAVRPVRNLIGATRSVVETGRINVRVPETGTGAELDELVQLFNRMLARIETLIKGMTETLDNVAHDLKTPMTRLRGVAEMALRSDPDREQYRAALASCIEESDRILKLLDCLMDISEAETGTMRLQIERIRLSDLIDEVVELYRYVAEEKHVTISVDCAKDALIAADRSRMGQALANLMDNAIKYNVPGGRITVQARQEPQQTIVTIQDTGFGIPAEDIPQIWDRLHRGDKSRSEPGLGLGLSLVRAIVYAHKGQIDVASHPGKGSTFYLRLPSILATA